MKLVIVAGSPRAASVSRRLAERAEARAADAHPDVRVDFVDLSEEAPAPFRGFEAEYDDATRDVVARVTRADAFILVSPVYNGSYSAALKNLFEHVNYKALDGKVAGLALLGGGDISFLQVRSHLASLMTYFNVHVVPRAVYARRDAVEDGVGGEIAARLDRLVDAVVDLARARRGRERIAAKR